MYRYYYTAKLSAIEKTNGGIIYLLPDILIKAFTLIPLVYLWRVVMSSGAEVGMTMSQMMSYTYASAVSKCWWLRRRLRVGCPKGRF